MEQKHQFVVVAVVLALLCLICQIHAIRLLVFPEPALAL